MPEKPARPMTAAILNPSCTRTENSNAPSPSASGRISRAWKITSASIANRSSSRKNSGAASPTICTGSRSGTRSWNGTIPGPSGLSAASSISPTTASTATCRPSRKNKAALIWESEPGEVRTLTYQQLHREVQKFANVLKSLGVRKGDRVAIYMGMTPELPIAMLACARIGAPHTVVFGGFSSNALVDRIHDSQAVAVITQDGSLPSRRRGETYFRRWKRR